MSMQKMREMHPWAFASEVQFKHYMADDLAAEAKMRTVINTALNDSNNTVEQEKALFTLGAINYADVCRPIWGEILDALVKGKMNPFVYNFLEPLLKGLSREVISDCYPAPFDVNDHSRISHVCILLCASRIHLQCSLIKNRTDGHQPKTKVYGSSMVLENISLVKYNEVIKASYGAHDCLYEQPQR